MPPTPVVTSELSLAAEWRADIVPHLLSQLQASAELRAAAFLALGHAALGYKDSFSEYLPAVIRECAAALPPSPTANGAGSKARGQLHHQQGSHGHRHAQGTAQKHAPAHTPPAAGASEVIEPLQCLEMLAVALGSSVAPHVETLVTRLLPCRHGSV